jgi:hypothetical protein
MRPPVNSFVWMAVGSVVGHSWGKKEETRWWAAGVVRRIGESVWVLSAMVLNKCSVFPGWDLIGLRHDLGQWRVFYLNDMSGTAGK